MYTCFFLYFHYYCMRILSAVEIQFGFRFRFTLCTTSFWFNASSFFFVFFSLILQVLGRFFCGKLFFSGKNVHIDIYIISVSKTWMAMEKKKLEIKFAFVCRQFAPDANQRKIKYSGKWRAKMCFHLPGCIKITMKKLQWTNTQSQNTTTTTTTNAWKIKARSLIDYKIHMQPILFKFFTFHWEVLL